MYLLLMELFMYHYQNKIEEDFIADSSDTCHVIYLISILNLSTVYFVYI